MLRIAVPNKGSLSEAVSSMLSEAGYRQRRDRRELAITDPDNDIEFFYLRPRDIAVYVSRGVLDLGITGRDLFLDADINGDAEELMSLGVGKSTFRFAGPAGSFSDEAELEGKRIATSYQALVSNYLEQRGINASTVRLDGAIETSIRLGVADVIADVVETGSTMRAAGLEPFGEPVMQSEAILIGNAGSRPEGLDVLQRRLTGVLVAHRYVLLDYDIPKDLVDRASALTPGLESPTVSPLKDDGWVAVRSMVRQETTNQVMDDLYALGARAILVTAINACRI
ncbi:MAG: ATP phosphoribosyltransferase [Galactobacter sp.]